MCVWHVYMHSCVCVCMWRPKVGGWSLPWSVCLMQWGRVSQLSPVLTNTASLANWLTLESLWHWRQATTSTQHLWRCWESELCSLNLVVNAASAFIADYFQAHAQYSPKEGRMWDDVLVVPSFLSPFMGMCVVCACHKCFRGNGCTHVDIWNLPHGFSTVFIHCSLSQTQSSRIQIVLLAILFEQLSLPSEDRGARGLLCSPGISVGSGDQNSFPLACQESTSRASPSL